MGIAGAANTADAACKRFGFTVNDYGKEGPTNDAKALLDKHVAKWASDNGISDYRIGRKSVKCELFLDFVVFDEHTCTASANVCWGGDMSKIAPSESEDVASDSEKPPAPVSKVTAGLKREKPAESDTAAADASATGEGDTETAAAEADAQTDAQAPAAAAMASTTDETQEAAAPMEEAPQATAAIDAPAASDDDKPGVSVSAGAPVVETGALVEESNASLEAKSTAPAPDQMAATGDEDEAAAASSAAAAAAAAAERAAAAAETAAAAAKEAAAAAVAASAANRGVIVPPIEGGR